jgi:hypothetical protein
MIIQKSPLKLLQIWLEKNRLLIWRFSIIILVILLSSIFAPSVAMGNLIPVFVFLGMVGIIVFLVAFRWPTFGLVAVMIGGMFVPYSGPGGINISQIGIAGLLGVWILGMLLRQKKIQWIKSRTIRPALLFALFSLLSFGLGQFIWYPMAQNSPLDTQLGGLAIHILSIGVFLYVANIVGDLRKLKFLTWSFAALGSIYVLGRFFDIALMDQIFQNGFIAGSCFWIWLVSILFSQALINREINNIQRYILIILLLVILYVAIIKSYDWKSGWFPPLVSVCSIIGLRYWRKVRYFIPLVLLSFYFLVTNSIGQEDWSWSTRLEAWQIVLNITKADPIFGTGFANYYWYAVLFPIRGYFIRFNSHSQYVDLIAQTGVVGLACFLWLFAELGILGFKLLKRVPEGFAKAYIFGALGGLAGTLVAGYLVDWVLPFAYNIGLNGFRASVLAWIFLGGIVSIEQMLSRKVIA